MDKTKTKNKRTVPIGYQQNQQTKYQTGPQKFNKKPNIQVYEKHDQQQNYDNESNQQYMHSSYQQRYSSLDQEVQNNNQFHPQEQSLDGSQFLQQKQSLNHYELTFKKSIRQNQQESFRYEEQPSIDNSKDVEKYFQDESQSYQEVHYNKNQQQKSYSKPKQLTNIDSLIDNREILYQKYHSALINYYYLHAKPSKTIQQKHKQYLLSLLVQQLQKNIFINGLKLNFLRIKDKKQSLADYILVKSQKQDRIQEKRSRESLKKGIQSESRKTKKYLNESLLEQIEAKLVIFEQITYGIVKKKLFECFDSIVSISKIKVVRTYKQSRDKYRSNSLDDNQESQYAGNQRGNNSQKSSKEKRGNSSNSQNERQQRIESVSLKRQKQLSKLSISQSRQNHSSMRSGSNQLQVDEDKNESQQEYEPMNESAEGGQHDLTQMQLQEEEHRKLQQLINYIGQLRREALLTDSQLRRYFIKWKLYLLESILDQYHYQSNQQQEEEEDNSQLSHTQQMENIQYEDQNPDYQEYLLQQHSISQDYDNQGLTNVYKKPKKQNPQLKIPFTMLTERQQSYKNQPQYDSNSQSNQSQSIHQDLFSDPIKQKKLILKSFLYEGYIHQFWNQFTQNFTEKRLISASKKLRQENLKKNVIYGLQLNIQWRQKQKAMDQYYQQIAQTQNLRELRSAELFYRTNLKTKYFFQLVKISQHIKCFRKLDYLTLKIYFCKIYSFADKQKRKQLNIQRFFIVHKNKIMFKSFQAWKNSTILSQNYIKLKTFCEKRDIQLTAQYFSVLQLLYKHSLVQHKKASNFYKTKQTLKVFKYLQFLSEQSRQLHTKERELKEYLIFSKGKQFYDSFYEFVGQRLLQHRLKIRSEKLAYTRQKQFIYERLQQWRNFIIKKQSYRAIQYRLVKLRQKQIKENILNIWLNQLDKRINKKDELNQSAQHKDWLVKYYGSLCQIASAKLSD